jgi:hypothetical protein
MLFGEGQSEAGGVIGRPRRVADVIGTNVGRLRSRRMTCPQCAKPMTAISPNSFRCEPCREIVIVFAVVSKFLPPKILPSSLAQST